MPACPCCGREDLSARQIRRHVADRQRELTAYLDAMNENVADEEDVGPASPNNDPAPHNDGPAPRDDSPAPSDGGPALGGVEPAPDNVDPRQPVVDLAELIPREDDDDDFAPPDLEPVDDVNNMDLDDGDDLFVPPPIVPPAPGILRNPPVRIDDWTSDDEDLANFAALDLGDGSSVGSADRDPEFDEQDGPLGLDPDGEPEMDDEELWAFLQRHLGDLAQEEWIDIYNRVLMDRDRASLKFLAARLRTHFSRATYEDLCRDACAELGLPSDFVAWRRLKVLSGLESRTYDCCVNLCCCFLGKYGDLDACPFCHNPRYTTAGKPHRTFNYTPLIPQLIGLFQNPRSIKNMRHRVRHEAHRAEHPGKISDVFDGEVYRTLRNMKVHEEDEYHYFDNPDDMALGLLSKKRWV